MPTKRKKKVNGQWSSPCALKQKLLKAFLVLCICVAINVFVITDSIKCIEIYFLLKHHLLLIIRNDNMMTWQPRLLIGSLSHNVQNKATLHTRCCAAFQPCMLRGSALQTSCVLRTSTWYPEASAIMSLLLCTIYSNAFNLHTPRLINHTE